MNDVWGNNSKDFTMFELNGFPYMPMSTGNNCGPTVVKQLLWYMAEPYSMQDIAHKWNWGNSNWHDTPYHHTRIWTKFGYKVSWFRANPELIASILRTQCPVVILSRKGWGKYHWQIITGFSGNQHDPASWMVSTGLGGNQVSKDTMDDELFTSFLDTRVLSIQNLAYVVSRKELGRNRLGKFWNAYQWIIGKGANFLKNVVSI